MPAGSVWLSGNGVKEDKPLDQKLGSSMNPKDKENISGAVSALQRIAEDIKRIEKEAEEALFSRDDVDLHRQKLEEKAMLLSKLHGEVAPFLNGMERAARTEIESGVKAFSLRAKQALDLGSIFYMAALLYPEHYREGDLNDLERFIHGILGKHLR